MDNYEEIKLELIKKAKTDEEYLEIINDIYDDGFQDGAEEGQDEDPAGHYGV